MRDIAAADKEEIGLAVTEVSKKNPKGKRS
jgi:hypothetical protein